MRRTLMAGVALTCALAAPGARAARADGPQETKGEITDVTVYRGQALVTRTVTAPGTKGVYEVVVTDLPEHVVGESIYAESVANVEVRSVRFRSRAVATDVRAAVRDLDAKIAALEERLAEIAVKSALLEESRRYLESLKSFTAATAKRELEEGVLNVETLRSLTAFVFAERAKIADEELAIARTKRDIDKDLALLRRERAEISGGSSRTAREAVLFVHVTQDGGASFKLRYLVDRATWSPSYAVRAESTKGDHVTLEYNALVQQMTGESWAGVRMALSTATPHLVATAPVLDPLVVSLRPAAQVQVASAGYWAKKAELSSNLQLEQTRRANRAGGQSQQELDLALTCAVNDLQILDLVTNETIRRGLRAAADETQGVTVTYRLPGTTSLPSRADFQLVQIASKPMAAGFYKLAAPLVSDYVYDQADVENDGGLVLLAGPASAYLRGEFVGTFELATIAAGERFQVGFGIDTDLRTKRELVRREETIHGGNKVVDFVYRIAVENFSGDAQALRIVDRIPQARAKELKVRLESTSVPLSTDARYASGEGKQGILRWDVEVQGHATGPKALAVEYHFVLEHDKQLTVGA